MSTFGGTQTEARVTVSTWTQTEVEEESVVVATPRKRIPKPTEAELDNLMIMEELNEIRMILEVSRDCEYHYRDSKTKLIQRFRLRAKRIKSRVTRGARSCPTG